MKTPKYLRPVVDFTANSKASSTETKAFTLSDNPRVALIQARAQASEKSDGKRTTFTFKDGSEYVVNNDQLVNWGVK